MTQLALTRVGRLAELAMSIREHGDEAAAAHPSAPHWLLTGDPRAASFADITNADCLPLSMSRVSLVDFMLRVRNGAAPN